MTRTRRDFVPILGHVAEISRCSITKSSRPFVERPFAFGRCRKIRLKEFPTRFKMPRLYGQTNLKLLQRGGNVLWRTNTKATAESRRSPLKDARDSRAAPLAKLLSLLPTLLFTPVHIFDVASDDHLKALDSSASNAAATTQLFWIICNFHDRESPLPGLDLR